MTDTTLSSGSLAEFTAVACGNQSAGVFLHQMVQVLHFFDDCVDGDSPLTQDIVYQRLQQALFDLPNNPFYVQHFDALNTVLQLAKINWVAANQLEAEQQPGDLEIAFIARSDYVNLILAVATITGGVGWAEKIAPDVRRFAHGEGFKAYCEALENEQRIS